MNDDIFLYPLFTLVKILNDKTHYFVLSNIYFILTCLPKGKHLGLF